MFDVVFFRMLRHPPSSTLSLHDALPILVGYPQLAPDEAEWIRSIRTRHEQLSHSALAPHFTLVFPLSTVDRKSTRLNSSHLGISYAVFCLKKKNTAQRLSHLEMSAQMCG